MSRSKFLVVLAGSLLSINLVTLLVGAFRVFSKPYELMHGEGYTCLMANLVGKGFSLYPEVSSTQLIANPHTPIYMLLTGGLSSIFGSSLLTGRIVSLVCGLLICGLVFLLVRKLTGNIWAGVLSALLVTSLSVFRFLSVLYRMDTMGLMFALVGVYLVVKYEERDKLIFWSIPFFLLAFFTKQNFIAAPIAVCIYLLIRNRGLAFKYIGILVGGLVGGLALGWLLTGGQMLVHTFLYMWYSLVEGNVWVWGVSHTREIVVQYIPLWVATGIYFGYTKVSGKRLLTPVNLYFLVVALILVGLTGKGGSAFHYGLETFVVGCILVGVLLTKALEVFGERSLTLKRGILGGVVFVLVVFQSLGWPMGEGYTYHEYMDTAEESTWEVVEYIKESGKPILTYLYSAAILAEILEEDTLYDPALLIGGALVNKSRFGWDQSEILHRLETGYYGLVILDFDLVKVYGSSPGPYDYLYKWYPRVTDEMAEVIRDNYDLVYTSEYMGSPLYPYKSFLFGYTGGLND